MKPVRLRFEARNGRWVRRVFGAHGGIRRWIGAGLLAVGLASMFAAVWELVGARQELAGRHAELQTLSHSRRVDRVGSPESTLTPEGRRAWNQVVRQLNTPWASVLEALETVTPEKVALVTIEPDARQASIRLQAEAKSLDALLTYAQALKSAKPFVEATPVKHETNERDSNRPVRLTVNILLHEARIQDGEAR